MRARDSSLCRGDLGFLPCAEGLGFLPVQRARGSSLCRGLGVPPCAERARDSSLVPPPWEQPAAPDEPRQARARRAPPEPRPRPPPDALTQPPAWRGAQLRVLAPPGGFWGPGLPPQPGRSLRVPRGAGGWSGAREARPARCGPAQESGPVQVVIRVFGMGAAAAAPFAAYRL